MMLSVVIPVYNEKATIRTIVVRVNSVDLPLDREIIVVDNRIKVIFYKKNPGKGAALKTCFAVATGDIIIIQDADLEYDPQDYPKLI